MHARSYTAEVDFLAHGGLSSDLFKSEKSKFASKMQPGNPPNHLHYHNTDIWYRDKAWLTSHLEPNMAPGHDCDEVVPWSEPCNLRGSEFDWIIPWKLIVSISTARLCSDPNVFSPSVPQHFSHWFGETIGILPSTGIATRKALCRKLHWVCERLTSDVWILCSWDLEVQLYGVFECVRQNLFCRICCQHEPVGSARDLERMIWHGWVAFLHLQEHILSDFYLMFASGTHAVIILATAQAYESIADQWNDSCMLVKNLWWMSKKKC